jgi:hypothetical protein
MTSQSTTVQPEVSDREDSPLPDIRNIKDPIYDYSRNAPFENLLPLTVSYVQLRSIPSSANL